MIRYLTAGESHGKGLLIIIDGVPANLKIREEQINSVLRKRQIGFGRGKRQDIERDFAEVISGIRGGKTIGSPLAFFIKNKDYENWKDILSIEPFFSHVTEFNVPRPGHADLAGGIKYHHYDFRNVLERSSARETAARIIAGIVSKIFLNEFNMDILGYVINIGGISIKEKEMDLKKIKRKIEILGEKYRINLRCPDKSAADKMIKKIKKAINEGDTLGGIIKIITTRMPVGLGSYTQWDKKLDARIARALVSIQAFKGVEFGAGFKYADFSGSKIHDQIFYSKKKGIFRKTNNAGGFEGGMTNGEPIVIKAVMKPISTVRKGLYSINIRTKKKVKTIYERSDVCAVPSASLIAENVVAIEIANAFMEKFGADEIGEIKANYKKYLSYVKKY